MVMVLRQLVRVLMLELRMGRRARGDTTIHNCLEATKSQNNNGRRVRGDPKRLQDGKISPGKTLDGDFRYSKGRIGPNRIKGTNSKYKGDL